jgi:hypothetical protein
LPVIDYRLGHQLVNADQDGFVLCQAGQELIRRTARIQLVETGKLLAVLGHLFRAEQFGAQRRGISELSRVTSSRKIQMQQVFNDGFAAFFEFEIPFI